ncbi:MAG: hypothetical protein HUU55_22150 [Myxococcales bacterium]|nr:hypothetical protein [Myxococcales bacterium]
MKNAPPTPLLPTDEHSNGNSGKQVVSLDKRAFLGVSSTYFAEGSLYAVVHNIADVMSKELGTSLSVIGLTSLFYLPWNLKFL